MLSRVTIDAVALTPATAEVLKEVRDNRLLAKSRMEVHPGGLTGAILAYQDKPSPQVVVVEEEDDDATLLGRIDQLAELCEPGTRVIVIGRLNDIKLYRTLTGRGVSEYLLIPVNRAQVMDALLGLFADPGASPRGKVIAVWGARGGAGASTLAQNLAWSLSTQLGEDVAYVDLDLAFGTSVLAFNLEAKQGVAELLAQPDRLDSVLLDRFLLPYDDHLKVLSSAADIRNIPVISVEAIDRLLEIASRMVPALVLDVPHVWADWSEHILAAADEVVLVARPELASLRDCKTLFDVMSSRRSEAAAIRLVLNGLDAARKSQLTAKDFEETLGARPALLVPLEPALFGDAGNNGQMLGEVAKSHKVVELIAGFALQLAGRGPARKAAAPKRKSLLSWLKK
jgi:pilus assembly protein CpaE